MLGFFSLFNENQNFVRKDQILFVHVPDDLPEEDIKVKFSKLALDFANKVDSNIVYLNYGKDKYVKYEYHN